MFLHTPVPCRAAFAARPAGGSLIIPHIPNLLFSQFCHFVSRGMGLRRRGRQGADAGCDEIRASPYDAQGYMLSALHDYWNAPFSAHNYDHHHSPPLLVFS